MVRVMSCGVRECRHAVIYRGRERERETGKERKNIEQNTYTERQLFTLASIDLRIGGISSGLKHKTRREKLEAAYDAATYTHEIGFPPPRPPPLTSSKGGTGKGADSGEGHR